MLSVVPLPWASPLLSPDLAGELLQVQRLAKCSTSPADAAIRVRSRACKFLALRLALESDQI